MRALYYGKCVAAMEVNLLPGETRDIRVSRTGNSLSTSIEKEGSKY